MRRDDPRRVIRGAAATRSSGHAVPPPHPRRHVARPGRVRRASRAGPGYDASHARTLERVRPMLTAEPVVWLSTVRPDGLPHLVPTWFWWDGEALLVFSKPNAVKVRNLRANPRLMVALGHPEARLLGRADRGRGRPRGRRRRRSRTRSSPSTPRCWPTAGSTARPSARPTPRRSASSRPASSRGAAAVPCTRPRSGQSARPCRTRRPCRSAGRCSRPGPDDPRDAGRPSPASRP